MMDENLIKVWKEDFSIVKSRKNYLGAFACIDDKKEITIIIEENKIDKKDVIEVEKGWKLIIFNIILDFPLTGFVSKISSALAEANIPIFVISSYSTDNILIKKENLKRDLEIFRKLEIKIK